MTPVVFEDDDRADARVVRHDHAETGDGDVEILVAVEIDGQHVRRPGNFRELEQCVRSIMLRGTYRPASAVESDARQAIAGAVLSGTFSADDLLLATGSADGTVKLWDLAK